MSQAIAQRLGLPGTLTRAGWELPDGLPEDVWQQAGEALKTIEGSVMWWLGDWLNYGERVYGETYSQALDATDYSYGTLSTAKWVAKKVEFSRRIENLSWSHHQQVANLVPEAQAQWLERAAGDGLTVAELRAAVQREKRRVEYGAGDESGTLADLERLVTDGRTFGTIYADPPWRYDNSATRGAVGERSPNVTTGSTAGYDGTLSVEDICALPVAQLAAADSHLHLWTTNGLLFEAQRVIEAWGFTYKSCFVWVKPKMGMGNYWRVSHEFLLFAVRGNAEFGSHAIKSWGEYPRGQHSAKPEQVRQLIEVVSPAPRLELFGRGAHPGWFVWGNQADRRNLFTLDIPHEHGAIAVMEAAS